MNAKELERKTREIASLRWGVPAQSEHINGVNFDCILHLTTTHWIAIETTCNTQIEKIRSDINNRLGFLRKNKILENTFVECYMVLGYTPTPNMVEYARAAKIDILSFESFRKQFFDYYPYSTQRYKKTFGSAFDLTTGKDDPKKYVGVNYTDSSGIPYKISDIADELKRGKRIILLGDYGTGKSRCIKEVFNNLTQISDFYTFCINLRDNWGLKRKSEIINRHFEDLGLSSLAENALRLSTQDNCIFLLDGFDEIGSQSWSTNPKKLVSLRKKALQGIAQIVGESVGGVLISGREQYFNTHEEMLKALGLDKKDRVLILRCPEEFTEDEMRRYLGGTSPSLVGNIPDWIPRKPLTYNVLSGLQFDDIQKLNEAVDSHLNYWNLLISYICEREAKIRDLTLEPETILKILKEVAHFIFMSASDNAIITPEEIGKIFHNVLGYAPDDDASIILQRLPGLGRVQVEGPNRYFCDNFLLNGLKASYLIDSIDCFNEVLPFENWGTQIDALGYTLLQEHYELNFQQYERYAKRFLPMRNRGFTSILVTLIISCEHSFDFKNITISGVVFESLSLTPACKNITFSECFFNELNISDCISTPMISLNNGCSIVQIIGIGSTHARPSWISEDCIIDNYQPSQKASELRKHGNISTPQMVLLIILQRVFFQRGSGRIREALFRGFEDSELKYVSEIVDILISQKFIKKIPCNGSAIYVPMRDMTSRVHQIKNELTRSSDPLWKSVSVL